mmetsp:Transcript_86623/g.245106  ORF Transcript_86623/g.245106 Transcript_86623/m.245106 type:complete len:1428 (+) Transcript_86623:183-4466(+)
MADDAMDEDVCGATDPDAMDEDERDAAPEAKVVAPTPPAPLVAAAGGDAEPKKKHYRKRLSEAERLGKVGSVSTSELSRKRDAEEAAASATGKMAPPPRTKLPRKASASSKASACPASSAAAASSAASSLSAAAPPTPTGWSTTDSTITQLMAPPTVNLVGRAAAPTHPLVDTGVYSPHTRRSQSRKWTKMASNRCTSTKPGVERQFCSGLVRGDGTVLSSWAQLPLANWEVDPSLHLSDNLRARFVQREYGTFHVSTSSDEYGGDGRVHGSWEYRLTRDFVRTWPMPSSKPKRAKMAMRYSNMQVRRWEVLMGKLRVHRMCKAAGGYVAKHHEARRYFAVAGFMGLQMMDQQPTALKLLKEGKDGQAVPLTETDHKEIVAHMLLRGSELSAKQPFPQGIRHFHTDTVGKYVRDFNDNGGSFSPIKTGHHAKVACLLDSAGVRSQFEEYVEANGNTKGKKNLTIPMLTKHVNEHIFKVGTPYAMLTKGVCEETVRHWLRNSGFEYMTYHKGEYKDGALDDEVLDYLFETCLPRFVSWFEQGALLPEDFIGVTDEHEDKPGISMQAYNKAKKRAEAWARSKGDPNWADAVPILLWSHDEACAGSMDAQTSAWERVGNSSIRSKGSGHKIMASEWLSIWGQGFIRLTEEEVQKVREVGFTGTTETITMMEISVEDKHLGGTLDAISGMADVDDEERVVAAIENMKVAELKASLELLNESYPKSGVNSTKGPLKEKLLSLVVLRGVAAVAEEAPNGAGEDAEAAAEAAAEEERQEKALQEAKAAREAEEADKAEKQTMLLKFLAPPKRQSEAKTKLLDAARSTTLRGRLSRVETLIKKLDSDVNEGDDGKQGASSEAFRALEAKVEALSSGLAQEHNHLEIDERDVTEQLDGMRQQLTMQSKAIEQNKQKISSTHDQMEERSHAQTLQLARTAITLQDQIRRVAAASTGPGSASAAAGVDPLPEWTTSAMARAEGMSVSLWEVARELESNVGLALDNSRQELSAELEADLENVQATLDLVMQTEDGGDWLEAAKLLCTSIRQTLQSAASAALHTIPFVLHRNPDREEEIAELTDLRPSTSLLSGLFSSLHIILSTMTQQQMQIMHKQQQAAGIGLGPSLASSPTRGAATAVAGAGAGGDGGPQLVAMQEEVQLLLEAVEGLAKEQENTTKVFSESHTRLLSAATVMERQYKELRGAVANGSVARGGKPGIIREVSDVSEAMDGQPQYGGYDELVAKVAELDLAVRENMVGSEGVSSIEDMRSELRRKLDRAELDSILEVVKSTAASPAARISSEAEAAQTAAKHCLSCFREFDAPEDLDEGGAGGLGSGVMQQSESVTINPGGRLKKKPPQRPRSSPGVRRRSGAPVGAAMLVVEDRHGRNMAGKQRSAGNVTLLGVTPSHTAPYYEGEARRGVPTVAGAPRTVSRQRGL